MKKITARMAFAALAASLTFGCYAQDILVVDGSGQLVEDGATEATTLPITTFSDELIGDTAGMQFFIDNESFTNALNITNITITGANAGDFVVADSVGLDEILPKPAEDDGYLILQFNPSALGLRTAQVNIFSNDPDGESVYTFAIAGSGVSEPSTFLPDLDSQIVKPKNVHISKEGRVTVKGKVFVENLGPIPAESSMLEIYITSKDYLDDTATLVKVRGLKTIKAKTSDKIYRRKVKYSADGNGHSEGYVFAVVTPIVPATDRNWSNNVSSFRYPDWN